MVLVKRAGFISVEFGIQSLNHVPMLSAASKQLVRLLTYFIPIGLKSCRRSVINRLYAPCQPIGPTASPLRRGAQISASRWVDSLYGPTGVTEC